MSTEKAKYWTAVMYPENMVPDWKESIGEILQNPYVYCVHDKDTTSDKAEDRKVHVHIVVAFPNTTTYKHAMSVFAGLNAPGKKAFNTCENVLNIRFIFNYLIHDTEDSRKKGKYQYSKDERISGNNFDIGSFEQLSLADKNKMCRELSRVIITERFTNYTEFYEYVFLNFGEEYEQIVRANSGHFARLTKGNFLMLTHNKVNLDIG